MLRGYARNHNSRLRDVAEAVIAGNVVIGELRRPRRREPAASGKKSLRTREEDGPGRLPA
jgi:hypothetical protein